MLPKKILVLRFSAMGDVALLVPVLRSLIQEYPELQVTVLTRPKFATLFLGLSGVNVHPADVDREYKGWRGLWQLFRLLKQERFNAVVDVHDHLRTKVLRSFFFLAGIPVHVFNKGRSEKKQFTRRIDKATVPLPHTTDRYAEVFTRIGFLFSLTPGPHLITTPQTRQIVKDWLSNNNLVKSGRWIGIAPFAMHRSKIWPVENYRVLFKTLLQKQSCHFFLFGGGSREIEFFGSLKAEFASNITVVAGVLALDRELALMQQLDLMVCVDSSNMHFATLVGTPIVSIWGGTHPDVGFGPFQRDARSIVQISRDELACRPCSVYGKETCHRGDFACMTHVTTAEVARRIELVLPVHS